MKKGSQSSAPAIFVFFVCLGGMAEEGRFPFSLECLSEDCLQHICRFLSDNDLLSLCCVSHLFCSLVRSLHRRDLVKKRWLGCWDVALGFGCMNYFQSVDVCDWILSMKLFSKPMVLTSHCIEGDGTLWYRSDCKMTIRGHSFSFIQKYYGHSMDGVVIQIFGTLKFVSIHRFFDVPMSIKDFEKKFGIHQKKLTLPPFLLLLNGESKRSKRGTKLTKGPFHGFGFLIGLDSADLTDRSTLFDAHTSDVDEFGGEICF